MKPLINRTTARSCALTAAASFVFSIAVIIPGSIALAAGLDTVIGFLLYLAAMGTIFTAPRAIADMLGPVLDEYQLADQTRR